MLFNKIWNSPTLMTWASFSTKSLTFFLILPLILIKFSVEDITLWYLFVTVINLQLLADIGFTPTFSRVIAFATSGAKKSELKFSKEFVLKQKKFEDKINWNTIEAVCGTMKVIYNRLTFVSVSFVLFIGSYFIYKPLIESTDPVKSLIAWSIIIVCSFFILRGNQYSAYLQGLNEIPLVRRWEAITNLGSIISSYLVLIFTPEILLLVIVNQLWILINIVRNYLLCLSVREGKYRQFKLSEIDDQVFNSVWPSSWRSGIGSFLGQAPLQFSGLWYAQIGSANSVASYLLGLRVLSSIKTFSNAPFYSKLPLLAKLWAAGNISELVYKAKKGMTLSYIVYVFLIILFGALGGKLLNFIGSNADFPQLLLWNLLAIGLFIEKYGAMHLQLYTTSNHVLWHIANGVTGPLFLICSWILIGQLDYYAFSVSYILCYLFFYVPYSVSKSYKLFKLNFIKFEATTMLPSLFIMIIFILLNLI